MHGARVDRIWTLPPLDSVEAAARLSAELGLPRAAAEVLLRRGLGDPQTARRFLDAGADDLHDPFLLPELEAAAHRVAAAVRAQERIVVHGDYDADGITGAALLAGGLQRLGGIAEPFVPDRMRDGYGVSSRLIEHAGDRGVTLLITVDTGSSAHEALSRAKQLGIDVIVCDHHLFDHRPEGATWLLNPQREDSGYPNVDLCGCGVAWKLLRGVATVMQRELPLGEELELVAIALLADQMTLRGENRGLVRLGLNEMARRPRPGVRALLQVAGLEAAPPDAQDIAFQIAPRINAPGRIASARLALDLLLTDDPRQAWHLAGQLDALNRQRQELDRKMTEEAVQQARAQWDVAPRAGLVLASERWHVGVVGIGAARLVERFHVPAILLSLMGDEARGSARSVPGFDLKLALDDCADLLTRYGGHAAAAGLTLPAARVPELVERFAEVASRAPRREGGRPLMLDAQLPLSEIDQALADFLYKLGPHGPGHPEPVFATYDLQLHGAPSVVRQKHLKLTLGESGVRRSFIGFGYAPRFAAGLRGGSRMDVAFKARFTPHPRFDAWQLSLEGLRVRAQTPQP